METKIKICGITSLADARYCAGAGADFLGFIQYPKSPRYVEPGLAKDIIDWVYGPAAVGVFVNEDVATVNRIADEVGFDVVQLHGEETPAACVAVERPVIKAVRVLRPDHAEEELRLVLDTYREHVEYFLLDTYRHDLVGGTGSTFDWSIAERLSADYPVLLAGGLTPENVGVAIRSVRPHGVDVSSGVEDAPGVKDFDKVNAFFDAVQATHPADELSQ